MSDKRFGQWREWKGVVVTGSPPPAGTMIEIEQADGSTKYIASGDVPWGVREANSDVIRYRVERYVKKVEPVKVTGQPPCKNHCEAIAFKATIATARAETDKWKLKYEATKVKTDNIQTLINALDRIKELEQELEALTTENASMADKNLSLKSELDKANMDIAFGSVPIDDYQQVKSELEAEKAKGEWISCTDRMPVVNQGVLISDGENVGNAKYKVKFFIIAASNDRVMLSEVTHWQPLPKPPMEAAKDE